MEKALRFKALGQMRGRGVFLTIMAIPLFVTVYFLIFLDLDIINEQSRPGAPPVYGTHSGRSFIKTIVKMQRALDDLGYDLSKVIGHRDHIRIRVKMFLSEVTKKVDDQMALDELQMVLDQSYFTNYTSIVRQQLLITCNQIEAVQQLSKPKWRNSYSYTEDGMYGFQPVRTVRSRTDLRTCSSLPSESPKVCRLYANHLAVRETLLLQQLQHPGIAKLVGYCIQDINAGVSYVVNAGKPLNMAELKSLPWEIKVQILWNLADLFQYLLSSPMGVIHLHPLTSRSFTLTPEHSPQLWDVSGVTVGEKQCHSHSDCFINGTSQGMECTSGLCDGFYNLHMLFQSRTNLFEPLLRTAPSEYSRTVRHLLKAMHNTQTKWTSVQNLLQKMGALPVRTTPPPTRPKPASETEDPDPHRRQVWYTGQDSYTYKRVVDTDLPGRYDYACPRSQVTWGCVVSMPTEDSAFRRCSGDPQCRAFVILSNVTNSGWINICFKNNYADLTDTPDSTLYIKVPQRGAEDEDLRMSPVEWWEPDGKADPDTLQACLTDLVKSQQSVRELRERRLMAILNVKDITEDVWLQSVSSGTMTLASVSQAMSSLSRSSSGGPGGSIDLHMGSEVVKVVQLIVREGPTMYHHSHLLFYHLDRLLGLYLTPPSKQHVFTKEELSFLVDQLPDFKERLSALVRQDALTGVLTALPPPGLAPIGQLELGPLGNVTHELHPLSPRQRNQLEYILLLWLSGTPRHLADMYAVRGALLHVDATDAFKQGVDTLLPYLYHCQFPRHTIHLLQALHKHKTASCSLGNQVLYNVQQLGVSVSDLHLHFTGTHQVNLLLHRTSEKLLDIVNLCIKRFGEDHVLYE